jgi:hypothetical protein
VDVLNVRKKLKKRSMDNFNLRKYLAEGRLYEDNDEGKIDKKFEDLMKKGLSAAAQLKNEPPSKKDKELNEAVGVTIATLVLGAPGILKVLSYITQAVGWLFGANKGDGNMFSRGLMKASKWLHHKYIDGIAAGLKAAYPEKYKNKNDKVIERDAQLIYAGMLALAIIATGIGAAHAASQVAQTLEVAHVGVDVADIVSIAGELAGEVGTLAT